jgi:hypothetical protein
VSLGTGQWFCELTIFRVEWAGPFPTDTNKHENKIFSDKSPRSWFNSKKLVHFETPTAFNGRPDNLRL